MGNVIEWLFAATGEGNGCAFFSHRVSRRFTDAAACARDPDGLAFEFAHGAVSFPFLFLFIDQFRSLMVSVGFGVFDLTLPRTPA